MTGLGGDAFWTIYDPASQRVTCVDGSGLSGQRVGPEYLRELGHGAPPQRGAAAMLTCPGAVSGWSKALELAAGWRGGAEWAPAASHADAASDRSGT